MIRRESMIESVIVKVVDPTNGKSVESTAYLAPLSLWESVTNKSHYASVLRKIGVDNRNPKFVIIQPMLEEGNRDLDALATWEKELSALLKDIPIVGPLYFSYQELGARSNISLSEQVEHYQILSDRILAAATKINYSNTYAERTSISTNEE